MQAPDGSTVESTCAALGGPQPFNSIQSLTPQANERFVVNGMVTLDTGTTAPGSRYSYQGQFSITAPVSEFSVSIAPYKENMIENFQWLQSNDPLVKPFSVDFITRPPGAAFPGFYVWMPLLFSQPTLGKNDTCLIFRAESLGLRTEGNKEDGSCQA